MKRLNNYFGIETFVDGVWFYGTCLYAIIVGFAIATVVFW